MPILIDTVAEEVDVGSRGPYYDSAGVVRDMFQNHLLQLLMITAMEAPARYASDAIRDEKVKVLHSMRPLVGDAIARDTLRGQYAGYAQAEGVRSGSRTATFAAAKLYVDNWRWQGVPFYLRSGKAMSCRTTQIVVQFHEPPHMIFASGPRDAIDSNRLVVQVQPAEGIQLHFETKVPDAGMSLRQTDLSFSYRREFRGEVLQPSTSQLLDELGLLEYVLAQPHSLLEIGKIRLNGREVGRFEFKKIAPNYPYAIWMPQPIFLEALRKKAEAFSSFQCWMGARATSLIEEGGKVAGVSPRFTTPFFKEFVLRLPKNPASVLRALRRRRILGGVALSQFDRKLKDCILVAVTERRTRAEIDAYAEALVSAVA